MATTSSTKKSKGESASAPADHARQMAEPSDWLSCALEHHDLVRASFETARLAPSGGARAAAMRGLAVVLTGHSIAEEVVLYPALALVGVGKHAQAAYAEQTDAKIEMSELERLPPDSPDWAAQLGKIETAVLEHMEREEGTWFLEIKKNHPDQARLTRRYKEEFERYTRTGIVATNGA